MARTPGSPKTGGRKGGTPNKKTLNLQEALESHDLDIVAQIVDLLPKLEPTRRADVLLDLMCYIYPKRKAVELSVMPETQEPRVVVYLPAKDVSKGEVRQFTHYETHDGKMMPR